MISVIVYGRNDNHGYNLPRRAALSLNCIAHVLSDEDEILFVDYNTPDDLPTFPEAISDTLTPWTRDRLRVLRVRPEHHRKAAGATRLPVVEPIARNVALRRTRRSRWVLSTNTDMLFLGQGANLLRDLWSDLDDGFYQLPRFELPEGLWESLDRTDPPGALKALSDWRARLPLDERVYTDGHTLFDGPGDFQLFLREDLFALDGFDERMIHGWHVDANIARRMALAGRPARSLEHLVAGYHCDHTRQASVYHGGDRSENSSFGFVDNLAAPDLPHQRDSWGMVDVDIEEIRLCSSTPLLRALDHLALPKSEDLETAYSSANYGALDYDAGHVVPFLLDQLLIASPGAKIGYVGARPDLLEFTIKGLQGHAAQVVVPAEADWLSGHMKTDTLEAWQAGADLLVFEIGAVGASNQAQVSGQEALRLGLVDRAFKLAVQAELQRSINGETLRKFIVVNAINNYFERQVHDHLAVTLTPFSSRVRHGYVIDRTQAARSRASSGLMRALEAEGISIPPAASEVARLRALVEAAAKGGATAHQNAACCFSEIKAMAVSGDLAVPEELIARLEAQRPSNDPRWAGIVTNRHGAAGSRFIAVEDWDNPDWLRCCQLLFPGSRQANLLDRDPWFWGRVSAAAPLLEDGANLEGRKVLLVSDAPEHLALALSGLGATVSVADINAWSAGLLAGSDWTGQLRLDAWLPIHPLRPVREQDREFDAILILAPDQVSLDLSGLVRGLNSCIAKLKPQGLVALSCQLALENTASSGITRSMVLSGELEARLAELGLRRPERTSSQWMLTARTLDRARSPGGDGSKPLFSTDDAGPAVVFLRNHAGPSTQAASSSRELPASDFKSAATDFELGSVLSKVRLRTPGRQTPVGLSNVDGGPLNLSLDLKNVPGGTYDLLLEGGHADVKVRAIANGPGSEATVPVEQPSSGPGWRVFQISLRSDAPILEIEIDLHIPGGGPIAISEILIR